MDLSSLACSAITKYHRLDYIRNRNFFLTVLEVGKSEIKVLAKLVSGEYLSLTYRQLPSYYVLFIWPFLGAYSWKELSLSSSSYKATNTVKLGPYLYELI